jgi:hypothetical protein
VQAEDMAAFTEGNFVKLFRLAQLMVEYLLFNQDSLAAHKAQLLQASTPSFAQPSPPRLPR